APPVGEAAGDECATGQPGVVRGCVDPVLALEGGGVGVDRGHLASGSGPGGQTVKPAPRRAATAGPPVTGYSLAGGRRVSRARPALRARWRRRPGHRSVWRPRGRGP